MLVDCYDNKYIDLKILTLLNQNSSMIFYEDLRKCKYESYKMINDSLKSNAKKNNNLSHKYNVDVYDYNGEEFYMLIHNTGKNNSNDIFALKTDITSLSLISDKRMKYYNDFDSSIVLGFDDIDIDSIMHVYNSDSFSMFSKDDEILTTKKINKLYTPRDLMIETHGYNEIIYRNIYSLKPKYVLCFDGNITNLHIEICNKFNIPIRNINRKKYNDKYKRTVIKMFDYSEDYVESYEELKTKCK